MSAQDYLLGVALLAVMLAATGGGAVLLIRRRLPGLRGAERVTACGLLTTLGILVVHLVPGMLAILGRASVIAASLAWITACLLVRPVGPPRPPPRPEARDPQSRISWALALVLAAAVGLYLLASVRDQLMIPPTFIDFTAFHMPTVAEWIQSGSMWGVFSGLPWAAVGNYPNNGDVLFLAMALPWHNEFLVRLPMLALHLLTGVAVYALACRLRAPRSAALVAASLVLAIPVAAVSAVGWTLVDSATYFGFAAGVLFLARHHQSGSTADLVLAGLALGFSFGAKWYGVSAVAVAIGVWTVASLVARRDVGPVLRQGAVLCGLVAVVGGVWLLRNWIESGNPVFPVSVSLLGVTIFDAPPDPLREETGATIAGYLGDPGVWRESILPEYREHFAASGALILLGAALAAVLSLRPGHRGRLTLRALAVGVVLLLGVYAILPYTAGGLDGIVLLVGATTRYAIPAFLVGAALAAWAAGRWRWGTVAFAALGLLAGAHGISRVEALGPASVEANDWVAAVLVATVLGLGLWLLGSTSERRRGLLVSSIALGAALAVSAGYEAQKRFNDGRYLGLDPAVDFILIQAGSEQSIGLTGAWGGGFSPVLPAYGPRYENQVDYVGPMVGGFRQRYENRDDFTAELDRGDYDLLIVGRDADLLAVSANEAGWVADTDYELVVRSERFDLYRAPEAGGGRG